MIPVEIEEDEENPVAGPLTVIAKYASGQCPHCTAAVSTGQMLVRCGGRWLHTRCELAAKAAREGLRYAWELA